MPPKVRYAKFDVPVDSRLQKYTQQLVNIIKNNKENDNIAFIAFRDQLFHDSFNFLRNKLKNEKYPLIIVDFVPTKVNMSFLKNDVVFVRIRESNLWSPLVDLL